jgi:hypothetical protein
VEYVVSKIIAHKRTWEMVDGENVKGTMQFLVWFEGWDATGYWMEAENIGGCAAFHDYLEKFMGWSADISEVGEKKDDEKENEAQDNSEGNE